MQFSVRDGDRLDEDVRPVARPDRNLDLGALAPDPDDLRPLVNPTLGSYEQQHGAATAIGVEHQASHLTRLVLASVGGQFQVIEAEVIAIEFRTTDHEHLGALDEVIVIVLDFARDAVLSGIGSLEHQRGATLVVGGGIPSPHPLLLGTPLLVVADPVKREAALPGNRAAVQRAGLDTGPDRLPGSVETPVDPGHHAKRLTGNHHRTGADNRPPRTVDHLGSDPVSVIEIGVEPLGHRCVDLQLHRPVLADLGLVLHDQFGRMVRPAEPRWHRARTPPRSPTWIPPVGIGEPPVARPVEPVPAADGEPMVTVSLALDAVLHLRPADRAAEVVLGHDLRLDLLAQRHRSLGCLDGHLVLRFLVFLDPERPAAANRTPVLPDNQQVGLLGNDADVVVAQVGVIGQIQFTVEPAPGVGGELAFQQFLVAGIGDTNRHLPSGIHALLVLVVTRLTNPELEPHGLTGPVDRPIGDHEDTGVVKDPGHAATEPG